jgi:hypothetical protein
MARLKVLEHLPAVNASSIKYSPKASNEQQMRIADRGVRVVDPHGEKLGSWGWWRNIIHQPPINRTTRYDGCLGDDFALSKIADEPKTCG